LDAREEAEIQRLIKENELKAEHPDVVKTHVAFEGDKNPETGEIGGPKGMVCDSRD
jgi:hypothetical protein